MSLSVFNGLVHLAGFYFFTKNTEISFNLCYNMFCIITIEEEIMAYIVFDMEWNQPMCAAQPMKGKNGVKLSGEIMQIGAIKLNENCEIIGDFSLCVKLHFYKRLIKRVRELTGIT